MQSRLGLILLLLLGPLAFAPAPFPKTARREPEPETSLKSFQGTWRIVSLEDTLANGRRVRTAVSVTHVRISGDRWTFLPDNYAGARLDIAIDHAKTPAQLTFYRAGDATKKTYGVGLIRRQGDEVKILYCWGGEEGRPRTFDPAPDGYYLLTLRRE